MKLCIIFQMTHFHAPRLEVAQDDAIRVDIALGHVHYRDSIYCNTWTRNVIRFTAKRDDENIIDCKPPPTQKPLASSPLPSL